MHPAHPVGVAPGEVVVDGDDVHAVAGERVEVGRQRRDQGLALTGLHLGDVAEVQRRAAHQLHLVVELPERAAGRLADDGERLGQQVVERLAVGVALLERVGQRAQLGVGQVDVVVLERLDVIGDVADSRRTILPSPARSSFARTTAAMVRARIEEITDWSQDYGVTTVCGWGRRCAPNAARHPTSAPSLGHVLART